MKGVRPGSLARLTKGAPLGAPVGVAVASLAGALLPPLGLTGLALVGSIALVGAASGLGTAYVRGRYSYIPKIVIDEMGYDKGCVVKRVTAAELQHACEMTRIYYGQEYVDFDVAGKWLKKNHEAFAQIVNDAGDMCSCFGFISMTDSCFDEFIKGRIKDGEFDEEDIMPSEDTKRSSRLYLSGVIVDKAGTFLGRKRADMMSWAMLEYYKRYFGRRKIRTLYSLAVSREGEDLLKAFGFELVGERSKRRDECNLYSIRTDAAHWNEMVKKVPNWSHCCTFDL